MTDKVEELLGPDHFMPTAIRPDGTEYAYDLQPARKLLRRLLGTHPGTSVPADSDDPQNVGSKPEDEKKCLCGKPAGHRKMGY